MTREETSTCSPFLLNASSAKCLSNSGPVSKTRPLFSGPVLEIGPC
jgi:hypothetical protein